MGSPERFVERLNRQLRKIGIVVEGMPVKTRPSGGPPCFRAADTNYQDWLAQASLSFENLPYRLSMPAEPNYCHDCTKGFKRDMVAVGACLFPSVTFEKTKELGESVRVGMSRSPDVAPEVYPVYDSIIDKRRG
jgi:hypothetical protein